MKARVKNSHLSFNTVQSLFRYVQAAMIFALLFLDQDAFVVGKDLKVPKQNKNVRNTNFNGAFSLDSDNGGLTANLKFNSEFTFNGKTKKLNYDSSKNGNFNNVYQNYLKSISDVFVNAFSPPQEIQEESHFISQMPNIRDFKNLQTYIRHLPDGSSTIKDRCLSELLTIEIAQSKGALEKLATLPAEDQKSLKEYILSDQERLDLYNVYELILQKGGDITTKTNIGDFKISLLGMALVANVTPIAELLIKYGADVNEIIDKGENLTLAPLSIAFERKNLFLIEKLLSHGASFAIDMYSSRDKTAKIPILTIIAHYLAEMIFNDTDEDRQFINNILVSEQAQGLMSALLKKHPDILKAMSLPVSRLNDQGRAQFQEEIVPISWAKIFKVMFGVSIGILIYLEIVKSYKTYFAKSKRVPTIRAMHPVEKEEKPKPQQNKKTIIASNPGAVPEKYYPSADDKKDNLAALYRDTTAKLKKRGHREILQEITEKQVERDRARALEEKERKDAIAERAKRDADVAENTPASTSQIATANSSKAEAKIPVPDSEVKRDSLDTTKASSTAIKRKMLLGEVCKHVLSIKEVLASRTALGDDVVHYSLLFNIFRCFELMKQYQHCGGDTTAILNNTIAVDLRNLIRHYGLMQVSREVVIKFAEGLKVTMPMELLKLKKKFRWTAELDEPLRKTLCAEFGLVETGNLQYESKELPVVLEHTELYKSLSQFMETAQNEEKEGKTISENRQTQSRSIVKVYLPLMGKLLEEITQMPKEERDSDPEMLADKYILHLQSLRFIALICAEYRFFTKDIDNDLFKFLTFCHNDFVGKDAHEKNYLPSWPEFVDKLDREFKKLYLPRLLSKMNDADTTSELTAPTFKKRMGKS